MTTSSATIWTTDRNNVRDWLANQRACLSELYAAAVELAHCSVMPGRSRLIGHAVREIRNILVESLVGSQGHKLNYQNRFSEIVDLWKSHKLPTASEWKPGDVASVAEPPPPFVVPQVVAEKLLGLLDDHASTSTTQADLTLQMFEAVQTAKVDVQILRPMANRWKKTVDWFIGVCHHRTKCDHELIDPEFQSQFANFETTLEALAAGFFSGVNKIDEILDQANV